MCSIIGSFYKEELKSLIDANKYRGNMTSSFTTFDFEKSDREVLRIDGPMSSSVIDSKFVDGLYHIIHMQAPTGKNSGIHPAESPNNGLLWHNGIILNCEQDWDTQQMVNDLDEGYTCLSEYDGSFACIHLTSRLAVFRNKLSPLFISDRGSISSTKIDSFKPLPAEKVFQAEAKGKDIHFLDVATFSTLNNPYDF